MKHWYKTIALLALTAIATVGEGAMFAASSSQPTHSPTTSLVPSDRLLLSQVPDRFPQDWSFAREGDCAVTRRRTDILDIDGNRIDTLQGNTLVRLQEDYEGWNYVEVGALGERKNGYVSIRDLELVPCNGNGRIFPDRLCREVTETISLYAWPRSNDYERIGRIREGEQVRLEIGPTPVEDAEGNEWVEVTTISNQTGWIRVGRRGRSILRDCR